MSGYDASGGGNVKEDRDLARALEESLRDQQKQAPTINEAESDSVRKAREQNKSIEVMVNNVQLRLSNEFDVLFQQYEDTLIYIGCPPKQPKLGSKDNAHILAHFDRFHVVNSAQLYALNSNIFNQLLRPNSCIRAEKRLKRLDAYRTLSDGVKSRIKYHIDMRPPIEDEEAILVLTDLSCSYGILNWHKATMKYSLPRTTTMGVDDLDTNSNPYQRHYKSSQIVNSEAGGEATEGESKSDIPDPSEYSALRHHSGIERLLNAIYGNDPKLDSAPKMWTYFALARLFDCAKESTVNKWIYSWFDYGTNKNFIQNNPEVSYRIGMGIGSEQLVKTSFSILVGERALMDVCNGLTGTAASPNTSIHGRQLENLDDDEKNRIDHAAMSLVSRVRRVITSIFQEAPGIDWMMVTSDFARLDTTKGRNEEEQEIIDDACRAVRVFVKRKMLTVIGKNLQVSFPEFDQNASSTSSFRHGSPLSFERTYDSIQLQARSFTRTSWSALRLAKFENSLDTQDTAEITQLVNVWDSADSRLPESRAISRSSLIEAIEKVNDIIQEHHNEAYYGTRNHPFEIRDHRFSFGDGKGLHDPLGWSESLDIQNVSVSPNISMAPTSPTSSRAKVDDPASPKRSSITRDRSPFSAGKRRKISDADQGATLTYRPAPKQPQAAFVYNEGLLADGLSSKRREKSKSTNFENELAKTTAHNLNQTGMPRHTTMLAESRTTDMVNEPDATLPGPGSTSIPVPVQQPQAHPAFNKSPLHAVKDFVMRRLGETNIEIGTSNYTADRDVETGTPVYKMAESNTSTKWTDLQSDTAPEPAPEPEPVIDSWWQDDETSLPMHAENASYRPTDTRLVSLPDVPKAASRRAVQQFSNTEPDDPHSPNSRRNISGAGKYRAWSHVPPPHVFSLDTMLRQLSSALATQCDKLIWPSHLFHDRECVPVDLIDSLMCLGDEEWRFLPLWITSGCDDGSGGVFDSDVPNLEAGGFRGGKRGIGSVNADGEGSVSGTESSFDDIASEARSTVGKASGVATDGAETVVSLGSECQSEDGFMNQDEIYREIQEMKAGMADKGKGKAEVPVRLGQLGDEFDFDGSDDGDVSTVMGAGSDVQGQLFGGDDDDDDVMANEDGQHDTGETTSKGKEKAKTADDESDDDMEIINKDDL